MAHIKVWCEYDFGGSFGGNNNEEVFEVLDDLTNETVDDLVLNMLSRNCSLEPEELDDLYGWNYTTVELLD